MAAAPARAAARASGPDLGPRGPAAGGGVLRGGEGGALGDDAHRVGVRVHRTPELLGEQARDQRDPGGPADEHDVVERHPGRVDGGRERLDGRGHQRGDPGLEVRARDPDRGPQRADRDGDVGLGVRGELLLGGVRGVAQAGQRDPGLVVAELLPRGLEVVAELLAHEGEDGRVDVGATRTVRGPGVRDHLRVARRAAADDGGAEAASAEVVDAGHGAARTGEGGGPGLGDQRGVPQPDADQRAAQRPFAVQAPAGRVRDGEGAGRPALAHGDPPDGGEDDLGGDVVGPPRFAPHDEGDVVAEAGGDVADDAVGLPGGPLLGLLAGAHRPVAPAVRGRGEGHRPGGAERDGLGPVGSLAQHRCDDGRASQVDAEVVTHRAPLITQPTAQESARSQVEPTEPFGVRGLEC